MRRRFRSFAAIAGGLAALALMAAPASAAGGPLGLSDAQALRLAEQEHPKILAEFGGEIEDAALKSYVDGVARKLLAKSAEPNTPLKVFVLDSPVINAMALPGHLYVTRGLLALADSEAELAGVVGHELGHILMRHTAKRVGRGNLAGLGALILGAVVGDRDIAQLAGVGAQLYVLKFSRKQEYQADLVGVKLIGDSGYDPTAGADFLHTLQRWTELEARIAGRRAAPPEFLSTHPNTAERVKRAAAEAKAQTAAGGMTAERARDAYLTRIDRLLYGEDPVKQGFIRGQDFIHPGMGLAFTAPSGFTLQNTSTAVVGRSSSATLQFTGAASEESPAAIIQGPLARQLGVQFANLRDFTVAGRPGAAGIARANTRSGVIDAHAYVVKWRGATNYLFLWTTSPANSAALQPAFDGAVASLRAVDPKSADPPPTLHVEVVTAATGDSAASLATRTAFQDYKEERFRILNSLEANEPITQGRRVKLVR